MQADVYEVIAEPNLPLEKFNYMIVEYTFANSWNILPVQYSTVLVYKVLYYDYSYQIFRKLNCILLIYTLWSEQLEQPA